MKKLLPFLFLIIIASCNKQEVAHKQMPPMDKELFNPAKDAEIAAKKNPHGNPHNNPGDTTIKKALIYLDTDGETINSPYWNNGQQFTVANSGLDQAAINEAVAQVTSDYSFNKSIVITTIESEYNSFQGKKIREILTKDWQWYGYYGGVSYVNSITWDNNTPCFVFTSLLGDANNVGKAATHEAGHTLGLWHYKDYLYPSCFLLGEYKYGDNMGYPYHNNAIWGLADNCGNVNEIEIINNTVNQ